MRVTMKTRVLAFAFTAWGMAAGLGALVLFRPASTVATWAVGGILALGGVGAFFAGRLVLRQHRRLLFLEGSLDAVAAPITTTDLNMKWVFINKVTESLLAIHKLDKKSVIGKHCSCWKADICNTDKCGIASLRRGVPRTHYNQEYANKPSTHMQVDTHYIEDELGRRIGHIEIVTSVDAASRLQQTAERISSSLEETSAALEEISAATRQSADNARQVDRLMGDTSKTAGQATQYMAELTHAMHEISATSKEISKIIRTIDEIAFQTNLLALNAAVEAARAGESGKGFAVVAEEVRNLARRAAEAARSTGEIIAQTLGRVQGGVTLVEKTSGAFNEVVDASGRSTTLVSEISTASHETAQGLAQITDTVAQMNQLVQESVSGLMG